MDWDKLVKPKFRVFDVISSALNLNSIVLGLWVHSELALNELLIKLDPDVSNA